MIPRLYDFTELNFTSNGIGPMTDIISCIVTETRNGECLLEAEYPTNGLRADQISELRYITAPYDDTNDPQPFVIYKVTRGLKTIKIYAKHVGMVNNNLYIDPRMDSEMTVEERFAELKEKLIGYSYLSGGSRIWRYPGHASVLRYYTDITDTIQTDGKVPLRVRDYIQGADGSIADHLEAGEVKYDKWQLRFTRERGKASGVTFRYGVNISNITGTTSSTEAYTGAVIYSTFDNSLDYSDYWWTEHSSSPVGILPNFKLVDLTPKMNADTVFGPRANKRNEAEIKKRPWIISSNITLTGYELSQIAEFAGKMPVKHIGLCDTVKVIYEPMKISEEMKVVKLVWNVLKERYDSMSVGTIKKNLNGTLRDLMLEYAATVR